MTDKAQGCVDKAQGLFSFNEVGLLFVLCPLQANVSIATAR